jgi:hypothetical protein
MSTNLGRLEKVELREAWQSESIGFTPWLAQAENIKLLGEAVGIELEVEAQEKDVGPFRADILCKDTATGAWVLIENQLELTDHTHLGQLMTYAAGLDAVTIVWVARRFTEEHRAALDWLNKVTDERINFFGLEIELWRIGDSPMAPKFNVISKPNDWSKSVSEGANRLSEADLSPTKTLQLEFWRGFRSFMDERGGKVRATKPFPQHWMNMALGRSGFQLSGIVSFYDSEGERYGQGEVRAEMNITSSDSKAYFMLLEGSKKEIEEAFGEPLTWYSEPDVKNCKAFVRRQVDVKDKTSWPDVYEWLRGKLESLHRVFGPRVRALTISQPSSEVEK